MAEALRVLNVSGGVQSSTLAYMAAEGLLEVDVAIWADTHWENDRTYAQLHRLRRLLEGAGIRWEEVCELPDDVDLIDRALDPDRRRHMTLPLWTRAPDGREGKMRELCTPQVKVEPIRRRLRALLEELELERITQYLGISFDERRRCRPSDVRYIDLRYPLVEWGMTRAACLRWCAEHGYPEPPQTSCLGCPLHDNAHWRYLRDHEPGNWARAIAADRAMRKGGARGQPLEGEAFLHRSRVPLEEADLRTPEERGQLTLLPDPGR